MEVFIDHVADPLEKGRPCNEEEDVLSTTHISMDLVKHDRISASCSDEHTVETANSSNPDDNDSSDSVDDPSEREMLDILTDMVNCPRQEQQQQQQQRVYDKSKGGVRFDMKATRYHDGPILSSEEWGNLWYDEHARSAMKEFFLADAHNLRDALSTKAQLDASKTTTTSGNILSYFWKHPSSQLNALQTLEDSLKTCCRAKYEHAMTRAADLVHKEALQEMYQHETQTPILGLERELLKGLRGTSASLVVTMLDQVDLLVEEQERSQDEYPLSGTEFLAYVSLYTSRPSRILAHELALALQHS